jgi:hypothetical protein
LQNPSWRCQVCEAICWKWQISKFLWLDKLSTPDSQNENKNKSIGSCMHHGKCSHDLYNNINLHQSVFPLPYTPQIPV